jgi:hypothetical protein
VIRTSTSHVIYVRLENSPKDHQRIIHRNSIDPWAMLWVYGGVSTHLLAHNGEAHWAALVRGKHIPHSSHLCLKLRARAAALVGVGAWLL